VTRGQWLLAGLGVSGSSQWQRREEFRIQESEVRIAQTPTRPYARQTPNPEPGELVLRGFCPAADIHSRVFQNLNDTENKQRGFH
jgi:hypothetical protein